jgi:N-glycosylase/DNA lyase
VKPAAVLPAPDFDLAMTLGSGQVFHWRPVGAGYAGVIGDAPLYVEQRGEMLLVPSGCEALASRYFALDHPMAEIYAAFPDDPAMRAALACCRGLRIIRQPLWECLATFITSALKQVAHIAQISHLLRQRFGQSVGVIDGLALFAYPTIERIAALEESELRACGLGFRARLLLATARRLADAGGAGELEAIRALDDRAALAALCAFPGVGTKVANCTLLFGYERLGAFPIDVWIERVLRERYFQDRPEATTRVLQEFSHAYFGACGGYAQQYLFHHARVHGAGKKTPKKIK